MSEDDLRIMDEVLQSFSGQYQRDVGDHWKCLEPGVGVGDCEDHAIGFYYQLKDRGFAVENMNLGICVVWDRGEQRNINHAVSIVRLEDGDYVLDQRLLQPVRWNNEVAGFSRWLFQYPVESGDGRFIRDQLTEHIRAPRPDFIELTSRSIGPLRGHREFRTTLT
jgi:predicted transglutaminase-like cysteine proteinase